MSVSGEESGEFVPALVVGSGKESMIARLEAAAEVSAPDVQESVREFCGEGIAFDGAFQDSVLCYIYHAFDHRQLAARFKARWQTLRPTFLVDLPGPRSLDLHLVARFISKVRELKVLCAVPIHLGVASEVVFAVANPNVSDRLRALVQDVLGSGHEPKIEFVTSHFVVWNFWEMAETVLELAVTPDGRPLFSDDRSFWYYINGGSGRDAEYRNICESNVVAVDRLGRRLGTALRFLGAARLCRRLTQFLRLILNDGNISTEQWASERRKVVVSVLRILLPAISRFTPSLPVLCALHRRMEIQERTLGREGQALRRDLDEAFDVFAQSVMATAMALEVISVVMPGRSIAVIGGPSSILRSYLVRKIVLSGADVRFVVLPGEADVVPEKPYLLTSQFYRKLCMLHGRANQGLLCLPYNELERHVDLLSSATLVVGAVHVFPPDIHGKVAAVCEGGTGRAIALSQNAPQYPLLGPAKVGNAKEQGPFLRFASQYLDGFVSQLGTRYVQRVSDAGFEVSTNLRILRND